MCVQLLSPWVPQDTTVSNFLQVDAPSLTHYEVGWRRNHFQLPDGVRKVLQDHLLPYVHLYFQEFIPSTARISTLAGGVELVVGRTPI